MASLKLGKASESANLLGCVEFDSKDFMKRAFKVYLTPNFFSR